jgi:hypothetical protein
MDLFWTKQSSKQVTSPAVSPLKHPPNDVDGEEVKSPDLLPTSPTTTTTTTSPLPPYSTSAEVAPPPTHVDDPTDSEVPQSESEPLAVILVNAMFHLLFLPDFTIEDPNIDFNEEDVKSQQFKNALMWSPGVGSAEKAVAGSSQFDLNRIDVLRLIVACFSDSLYQFPDSYDSCLSYWLEVGTSANVPYAEIVFYSLINTVLGKFLLLFSLIKTIHIRCSLNCLSVCLSVCRRSDSLATIPSLARLRPDRLWSALWLTRHCRHSQASDGAGRAGSHHPARLRPPHPIGASLC